MSRFLVVLCAGGFVLASGTLTSACGETVAVEVAISDTQLVRIDTLRVVTVPIVASEAGVACRALKSDAETAGGLEARQIDSDTGTVPVCDFVGGAEPFVEDGLRAHVVVGATAQGKIYFTGCNTRDWTENSGTMRILVSSTPAFRTDFPAGTSPPSCTPEDVCRIREDIRRGVIPANCEPEEVCAGTCP